MSDVVGRWEWRSFAGTFDDVEERFGAPEQVIESDETYLLGATSGATVKIRHALMDVKQLVQLDDFGLEQWTVAFKAPFPLSQQYVDQLLAALRASAPARPEASSATGRSYTLRELLDEIVGRDPRLLAVDVHKRRERHTLSGCVAELTEVSVEHAGARSQRTVAIESEEPASVIAAVRSLGLAPLPNVCFPRGLKAMVGFGSEPYAVIDVGTNSVKFHIGQRGDDGGWRTIADRAAVTRLGEGLQQAGRLTPEPIARTVDAVAGMVDDARQQRVAGITVVGTAGLRMAPNGDEVAAAVHERCGIDLEIISGEEEGRLAYVAAVDGLGASAGTRVVFDTGGGSSQFTFGRDDRVDERFSLPVGAVRFTERYRLDRPVSAGLVAEVRQEIAADLSRLEGRPHPDQVVAMGGAVTNLAAVKHALTTYDASIVQGTVLDRAEIERQIDLYRTRGATERRSIVGLQPTRAEVILAGALIVITALDKLGADALTVSDRGLRHGVLAERYSSRTRGAV